MLLVNFPKKLISVRLVLVCAVSATVALSMALISIGKFLLFVFGAAYLIWKNFISSTAANHPQPQPPFYATRAILMALAVFCISWLWTSAEAADASASIAKYGKLLTIILIPLLLKNRQETLLAIAVFALAQLFLVLSSWLLFMHVQVPWATSKMAATQFAVFSTYLDQGVMSATAAAVCWHLRRLVSGRYAEPLFIAIAFLCITNALFVLIGRSGHAVAIVLLSLAVMWELPKRYRAVVVALPLIFLFMAVTISPKVQSRAMAVVTEVQAFSFKNGTNINANSSSGIRLHFWNRSVQSMTDNPFFGAGVGSWAYEFKRIENILQPQPFQISKLSNPHQEYLLWGVQLGVPGIILLLFLFLSLYNDTAVPEKSVARAGQSVIAALAVNCFFNSGLYDALIGDFFCVLLGLMLSLAIQSSKQVTCIKAPAE